MSVGDPPDDDELGELDELEDDPALSALRAHDLEIDPEFEGRVSRRIERRQVSSDLADLMWSGPITLLAELFKALFPPPLEDTPKPDPEDGE